MNHLATLITLIFLLNLTTAQPSPIILHSDEKIPKPTRLFTVGAFQSPYPVGKGLTGLTMSAQGGSFFLNPANATPTTECNGVNPCPLGTETVLFVDEYGNSWLDSAHPQPIYVDTENGPLSYSLSNSKTPTPGGAYFANFFHLGYGTTVTTPSSDPRFANGPTGKFNWIGSFNNYWFVCPRPGLGYQVMKYTGITSVNWQGCTVLELAALDYSGKSPAAGVYI